MGQSKLPETFYSPEELAEKERIQKEAEMAKKQPAKEAQPSPAPHGGEIGNADKKTIVVADNKPAAPKPMVTVGESGALNPTDIDQQWRMACALSQTGMLGPTYEGKPGAVMLAINLAMEKGKNPFSYLASTYEVKGRITEWGADALGAVYASGKVKTLDFFFMSKEGKRIDELDILTPAWAAVALGERSDLPVRVIRYFTEDDARKARLLGNEKKEVWTQYTRRMLETKAIGSMLKVCFPDVIAGIAMPDYDEHEPEPKNAQIPSGGAKARLLSDQSEAAATGEGSTVSSVREEAVRSMPRENVQGDSAGRAVQFDTAMPHASPGTTQELVQVPKQAPKGAQRTRGSKRMDDRTTSLPS